MQKVSADMGHSGFDGTPTKPRLRTENMRGPSDGAIVKRNECEARIGELWAETEREKQAKEKDGSKWRGLWSKRQTWWLDVKASAIL